MLFAPLMSEGRAIGIIIVTRRTTGAFGEHHVRLLQTFADQAVIAIENMRLFNETREALERQTATSDILKVIASSPSDVQPVFDVIVERAVRLCGARMGRVYRYDGELIHMVGGHGLSVPGRRRGGATVSETGVGRHHRRQGHAVARGQHPRRSQRGRDRSATVAPDDLGDRRTQPGDDADAPVG